MNDNDSCWKESNKNSNSNAMCNQEPERPSPDGNLKLQGGGDTKKLHLSSSSMLITNMVNEKQRHMNLLGEEHERFVNRNERANSTSSLLVLSSALNRDDEAEAEGGDQARAPLCPVTQRKQLQRAKNLLRASVGPKPSKRPKGAPRSMAASCGGGGAANGANEPGADPRAQPQLAQEAVTSFANRYCNLIAPAGSPASPSSSSAASSSCYQSVVPVANSKSNPNSTEQEFACAGPSAPAESGAKILRTTTTTTTSHNTQANRKSTNQLDAGKATTARDHVDRQQTTNRLIKTTNQLNKPLDQYHKMDQPEQDNQDDDYEETMSQLDEEAGCFSTESGDNHHNQNNRSQSSVLLARGFIGKLVHHSGGFASRLLGRVGSIPIQFLVTSVLLLILLVLLLNESAFWKQQGDGVLSSPTPAPLALAITAPKSAATGAQDEQSLGPHRRRPTSPDEPSKQQQQRQQELSGMDQESESVPTMARKQRGAAELAPTGSKISGLLMQSYGAQPLVRRHHQHPGQMVEPGEERGHAKNRRESPTTMAHHDESLNLRLEQPFTLTMDEREEEAEPALDEQPGAAAPKPDGSQPEPLELGPLDASKQEDSKHGHQQQQPGPPDATAPFAAGPDYQWPEAARPANPDGQHQGNSDHEHKHHSHASIPKSNLRIPSQAQRAISQLLKRKHIEQQLQLQQQLQHQRLLLVKQQSNQKSSTNSRASNHNSNLEPSSGSPADKESPPDSQSEQSQQSHDTHESLQHAHNPPNDKPNQDSARSQTQYPPATDPGQVPAYDIPQVECNATSEGFDQFACTTQDEHGNFWCLEDRLFCDGYYDCPGGEDEDPKSCMFYKVETKQTDSELSTPKSS